MKTKNIRHEITFDTTPDVIYSFFTKAKMHESFTGEKAYIDPKVGGKFTAYGDYITGTFLELKANKKIVQTWHASDWPEGVDSEITIELSSPRTRRTIMNFVQKKVPADLCDEIEKGWTKYYWNPMKKVILQKRL